MTTNKSKTASHNPANAKTFSKFASTLELSMPMSATLMVKRGLPARAATLSAVKVLPTPGTPMQGNALSVSQASIAANKKAKDNVNNQRAKTRE